MSATKQVNLNIDELNVFVEHMINNNRFIQKEGDMPVAISVMGESGIGKTSAVIKKGAEMGLEVVKRNLAQIEELSELVGYPVRQFQLCKSAVPEVKTPAAEATPAKVMVKKTRTVKQKVNQEVTVMEMQEVDDFEVKTTKKQVLEAGKFVTKDIETKIPIRVNKEVPVSKMMDVEIDVEEEYEVEEDAQDAVKPIQAGDCIWVDEQALGEYTKRGFEFTGKKRMSYCPPEWIADRENAGGILFIDDFNRADVRFQQAIMELIDRQTYFSWSLPKDWHIILSANPEGGDYFVTDLDPAQKTRFISVNLQFDIEVWARWAEGAGVDNRGINFLLMHPELVTQTTNARSITTFYKSIKSIPNFEDALPLIQMIGEGSVGPEFSILFTHFIHNKLDKMISPKDILLHESEQYIIGALRSTIGRGNDYRADIASVMSSRIINYSLHYAENNSITQKEIDRLTRLLTDPDLFTNDLQYHMVKKIINGNKKKFEKLMTNPQVLTMAMK